MSSKLFKVVFAGAVTVGALLLPVSAAQASVKHHPCNEPGFNDGAFFGDRMGFPFSGIGFPFDGLGSGDHHRRHHHDTVIVVTSHHKRHHHKPAATGNGAATGYHKPAATGNSNGGYHKSA